MLDQLKYFLATILTDNSPMPHLRPIMIALFFILGGPIICLAATDLSGTEQRIINTPTIGDLITYAYQNNPEIKAAKSQWQMEIERYRVTTAYPDPQLMVTYFTTPIETRLGPQDWNASLSQKVPFPGKLSKAGEMVSADAKIARLGLDKAVRDTIVSLRIAFNELIYISRATDITAKNQALLEQIRKSAETSYAEDRTALNDVVKAQSQSGQLRYDALLLSELAATERIKINSILNRPPEAAIGQPITTPVRPLLFGINKIYELAEENQEELQIASQRVIKAVAGKDLALYKAMPDFKIGLFYAAIGEPDTPTQPADAGADALGIQAGMSIPLWFGKSAGRIGQAKAKLNKARSLKAVRLNKTRAAIKRLHFQLNNAQRLIDLYEKDLLPQAAAAISTAETWYRNGQGNFSDFIEAQSTTYNFELARARAEADYGKYLAKLEGLCGRSLTVPGGDKE